MPPIPVIAILDIGKTNKKIFLFDEAYRVVYERSEQLKETRDEDGYPCEDIEALRNWVEKSLGEILVLDDFDLKAVNVSAYGASFVLVDGQGISIAPLYNYLKPYPENLKNAFYSKYGGEEEFARVTASPVLGSLNSGMQLYRLKQERPALFRQLAFALHLPQYISYLVTGRTYSEITSIGCHTALWDFVENRYHDWVYREGIHPKLAGIVPSDIVFPCQWKGKSLMAASGLHDSSAALIPYLSGSARPFVLLSTGTWCISLNPFNQSPLSSEDLQKDCLQYLSYKGQPIKASRLFAGNDHEAQVKRIAAHFNVSSDFYQVVEFEPSLAKDFIGRVKRNVVLGTQAITHGSGFAGRELDGYSSASIAYHQLMVDIVQQQVQSTNLVIPQGELPVIYVDGGFGKNKIFMRLLADSYPKMDIYAAAMAQASALGAALAIHAAWNKEPVPDKLIGLTRYSGQ